MTIDRQHLSAHQGQRLDAIQLIATAVIVCVVVGSLTFAALHIWPIWAVVSVVIVAIGADIAVAALLIARLVGRRWGEVLRDANVSSVRDMRTRLRRR